MHDIRPIEPHELEAFARLDAYAFGYEFSEAEVERYRRFGPRKTLLAAFADGRMVAHLGIIDFEIAFCGLSIPMGGIDDVATWPEDRRAGHTDRLLRAALERMRDAGQPLSMLYPTFFALYRRYGWATAGEEQHYTFRAPDLSLLPAPEPAGRCERLTLDQLGDVRDLYQRAAATMNGAILRGDMEWSGLRWMKPPWQLVLWRDDAGTAQGYVIHSYPRRAGDGPASLADQTLRVRELIALTPAAYRALVMYLARHDLVGRVTWAAPAGDSLPHILAAPDVVRVETLPSFMLRIVELPAAVAARPYAAGPPARVVLRVADAAAPWNDGVWRIEVENGHGRAVRCDDAVDLSLDIATLSALYNGYLSPRAAWWTGQIEAPDPAALDIAARVFAVPEPPACLDHF